MLLLIEQEPDLRGLLHDIITRFTNLEVTAVLDGTRAVEACGSAGVVLLDAGRRWDVVRSIKRKEPTLPIIAMTGNDKHAEALGSGCDIFLVKPFGIDELLRALDPWLKSS